MGSLGNAKLYLSGAARPEVHIRTITQWQPIQLASKTTHSFDFLPGSKWSTRKSHARHTVHGPCPLAPQTLSSFLQFQAKEALIHAEEELKDIEKLQATFTSTIDIHWHEKPFMTSIGHEHKNQVNWYSRRVEAQASWHRTRNIQLWNLQQSQDKTTRTGRTQRHEGSLIWTMIHSSRQLGQSGGKGYPNLENLLWWKIQTCET